MQWILLFTSHGWGGFGSNTDAQERKCAKQHHYGEEWCLLGTLEDSRTYSTKEAFCKCLLSPFRFRRIMVQLLVF